MRSTQITVRNVPPELADRLKRLGSERGESLNATVLRLLQTAVGINRRRERLERYATWTDADAAEFNRALAQQRTIDASLWE